MVSRLRLRSPRRTSARTSYVFFPFVLLSFLVVGCARVVVCPVACPRVVVVVVVVVVPSFYSFMGH